MDEQLGILFDYVRAQETLRRNTLILVCSDNGPEQGAGTAGPLRGLKTMLYEGGIRIPMIVRWPGQFEPGTVVDQQPAANTLASTGTGVVLYVNYGLPAIIGDHMVLQQGIEVPVWGWADPGKGVAFFLDGHANRDGKCPINTSGGLIAKGHPISATGIAMVGWIHNQLTGKVPEALQVKDAKLGLAHNMGGSGASSVVHILKRV